MKNLPAKSGDLPPKPRHHHYPIVAIGASAGGIEAVSELLQHLPPKTGMAYIYIQHLDPTHKSLLSSILSKKTTMRVWEAENLMKIRPDHLYVIPPNKDMTLIDGVLKLTPRTPKPSVHLPIDKFFLSLSEKNREGAIGIILSGNLSDGAIGLKAIKVQGGFTFAQDETAKYHSMPKAAVTAGGVDLILPPAEIARELARLATGRLPNSKNPGQNPDDIPMTELMGILGMVRASTGVDFSHYKKGTIRRRIVRRMILHKKSGLKEYETYLRANADEINILYQDLLINVTTFFRDAAMTEYLRTTLLPDLIRGREYREPLRIWVPACATGEEAYSMAILCMEVIGEHAVNIQVQIFGTDLSEAAIGKARLGVYTPEELADVPPARLQRFFSKLDGKYRIVKTIRDMCIFAPHNLLKDPPFSRLDIISCCNLFIYLDTTLQRKVMSTFHYSLKNNGHLILGKSETASATPNLFTTVNKKLQIYLRKQHSGGIPVMPASFPIIHTQKKSMAISKDKTGIPGVNTTTVQKTVDAVLLDSYMPACVVINLEMDILEFRGSLGIFMEPSPGRASLNILKMAHADLSYELRTAIHKVIKSDVPYTRSDVQIKYKRKVHYVRLTVSPLPLEGNDRLYLIVFQEMEQVPTAASATQSENKRIIQLEKELAAAKEDTRMIIEEQEAANEELQSANEEIVSSNEELQSINEEIETAKEELESTNEELLSINNELQISNEQLTESNEYAEAVLVAIREGVLVMDGDLRIKTANNAFYQIFRMKKEEVEGRVIFDLADKEWNIPRLRELFQEITSRNKKVNGFEIRHSFPGIGERVLLLNAHKITERQHSQDVVLVAIEDVTGQVSAARLVAEREEWLTNIVNTIPVMMWVAGPDGSRNFFNKMWLQYTGNKMHDDVGSGWQQSVYPEDLPAFMKVYDDAFEKRKPFKIEYRLRRQDGEYLWIVSNGKPTYDQNGTFTGFIGICTEIHEKVMINDRLEKLVQERTRDLRQANESLGRTNESLEQYAYVASHDMQEPLRKIVTFAGMLDERFADKVPAEGQDYIRKINANAGRMSTLINDLLNFSRLSHTEADFKKEDLNELLRNVLGDFDLLISQRKAKIEAEKLPALKVSAISMRQLFYNLISNGLKFTKPGSRPVITITTRPATAADTTRVMHGQNNKKGKYQLIEVSDNGIGFDQRYAEKIFQIFQRLNTKEAYTGSGIGLAIVKRIIDVHQGYISATSTPDQGTTFSILLPR